MNGIKAVIFDMDGLMFDTERLSAKYWIQAGEETKQAKLLFPVFYEETVEKCVPENGQTDLKTEFEHVSAGCLGNEGLAVRAREEFNNIKKPVLGKTGFDKLIEISNRFGCMEAVSLLMDARYRAFPVEKKKIVL